jgi:hypothetical protein
VHETRDGSGRSTSRTTCGPKMVPSVGEAKPCTLRVTAHHRLSIESCQSPTASHTGRLKEFRPIMLLLSAVPVNPTSGMSARVRRGSRAQRRSRPGSTETPAQCRARLTAARSRPLGPQSASPDHAHDPHTLTVVLCRRRLISECDPREHGQDQHRCGDPASNFPSGLYRNSGTCHNAPAS